jgi:hypothetical protein
MANTATSYQAQVEKSQYKGWSVYRLTNGIVSLYVAPDIGGRAIQMQLATRNSSLSTRIWPGRSFPPNRTM